MIRARKLAYIARTPGAWRPFLRARTAPAIELLGVLHGVRPATVVDVGANAGQFALLALLELGAECVISFEPLTGPGDRFQAALGANGQVQLHRTAVGSIRGSSVMHVSARDDSSSLLPIGEGQTRAFPGTHQTGVEHVQMVRLAEAVKVEDILAPALLKIDVQGFEMEVLRSCVPLLERFRWVLVEASFDELYEGQALAADVLSWMGARGWHLVRMRSSVGANRRVPVQADMLFEK